ncbi:MAG: hypothetical protein ACFCUQ_07855 [Kiloniellales bacterium]
MTKLLDDVIERIRRLPSDRQDEAAEVLLSLLEQDPDSVRLSPAQAEEVTRRLGEPSDYASHAEVGAYFKQKAR